MRKYLEKYNNLSIQAKASIWFVICNILQRGISLITVPIFTRMMSTEEYGYYSNYISWFSIILVFSSLSLYYGVFNNAMMKYEKDRERYIASMQGLTFCLTGSLFIIYIIFKESINDLLGMPSSLVFLMFIELLVYPSMQFWSTHNRFDYKYKKIVIVTLVQYITNPILGILFVLNSDNKAVARILSIVIVELIFYGFITVLQYYKGKVFYVKEYWKYALLFNLPLLPHYLSGQVLSQSDRVMIKQYVGYSSVAMYSVAYNIGILMNIFLTAINGSYTPWFYQSIKKKKYLDIYKISSMISIMMSIIITVLMIFGPEIMFVVAPRQYESAVYVIPPVAASVFFTFLYNLFANVEFYFEKNKFVMYASLGAAVVNLILNYIFIPLFGYIAAAYTTLFCYILYAFTHYMFSEYTRRSNSIHEELFSLKILIFLSMVVLSAVLFISILYKYTLIRYIVVFLIIMICIIKKNIITDYTRILLSLKKSKFN